MRLFGAALAGSGFASLMVIGWIASLIGPDVWKWLGYLNIVPPGLLAAGLLLLWIDHLVERHTASHLIERLLATSAPPCHPWRLPAPESYVLLRGVPGAAPDVFRLGFVHLVATGVLNVSRSPVDKKLVSVGFNAGAARPAATGSLSIICALWTSRGSVPGDPSRSTTSPTLTTEEIAQRLRLTCGGTDGFATAVLRELRHGGFFAGESHEAALTRDGEIARAELEGHLAEVLRTMRRTRADWVDRHPREALMAAVVHVAARREPPATSPELLTEPRVDWGLVDSCTRYLAINFDAAGREGSDGDGGDGGADGD